MNTQIRYSPRSQRAKRRDGVFTRNIVLEAAGKVFAERGFAEATSKEICDAAGTNHTAVNYYFGSKEGLYEDVLVEAHRQILSMDNWEGMLASDISLEEKLKLVLNNFIETAKRSSELWGITIFLRELATPSAFMTKGLETGMLPMVHKLMELLQRITGLPDGSADLQRATAFVFVPCLNLLMFPNILRSLVLPATLPDSEGLLDSMMKYVLGGLHAISKPTPKVT
jgi:AcrR family transcriptional regulator